MADTKAKLTLNGDTAVELDVLKGTLGQDVIDIRTLGSKGVFTFDPGFTSTASCESKITFIDGDEGILLHRGFPIDQLATDSNYLEVCYILLNGEKPTQEQYDEFKTTVTRHTMIHEQITRLFHAFRRDSHPMAAREQESPCVAEVQETGGARREPAPDGTGGAHPCFRETMKKTERTVRQQAVTMTPSTCSPASSQPRNTPMTGLTYS